MSDPNKANPLRVLLPIHLDRWRHPIASKLREVATRMPDLHFSSFSSPETPEDQRLAPGLWSKEHIHRISLATLGWQRFDIVYHASATPANIAASLLAKARGMGHTRHVFTVSVMPRADDRFAGSVRLGIGRADHVLAVSKAVAEEVEASFGRKVEHVVPNGVDADFFSPGRAGPVDAYGLVPGYVVFIGAMVPRKHPERVLEMAALMPDTEFVMVGRGDSSGFTEKLQREIAGAPNVRHLGFLERGKVRDILGAASVLVHPSEVEGMSNVTLEAGAMGVPVVGLPLREMSVIVERGVNGWLLDYDGPESWAHKVKTIINWDRITRAAFAETSRAWVGSRFTWEAAADALRTFLMSIQQTVPLRRANRS